MRPTRSLRSRLPEETGVVVALLVLVGFIGITNRQFLAPKSLFQLLANGAFTGMLALGMVFVVVIRDIDLSIGWMFNFSAVIAGKAHGRWASIRSSRPSSASRSVPASAWSTASSPWVCASR